METCKILKIINHVQPFEQGGGKLKVKSWRSTSFRFLDIP